MITGSVTADREAVIELAVFDAAGARYAVKAVVDTGFNGWLSLPANLVTRLNLAWSRRGRAFLADGSEAIFDIYDGTVEWDGRDFRVPIDEADTYPLVGMSLLAGYELHVQVQDGGEVRIPQIEE